MFDENVLKYHYDDPYQAHKMFILEKILKDCDGFYVMDVHDQE